jgi:peroxiredoxin/outer membrane lipoprotein-sorting protein
VSAKETDQVLRGANLVVAESTMELTAQGADHYHVHMKGPQGDASAVSDGSTTWKALASSKQWSRIEAATVERGDNSGPSEPRSDLYGSVATNLFSQYGKIAKVLHDPEVLREDIYKLGAQKVPCYVLRARAPGTVLELWIDRERFQILQRHQVTTTEGTRGEVWIKASALELNPALPESIFHFEPAKGWREVESLTLPGESHVDIGVHAANFTLKTLEGEKVDLAQTRGKVVVLDFWATWCGPCRRELPTIEKLSKDLADTVQFFGVNDEDAGTVRGFMKSSKYDFPVLMDSSRKVHQQYLVSAIPTMVIIDKQGIVRELFVGTRSEGALRKAIQAAMSAN